MSQAFYAWDWPNFLGIREFLSLEDKTELLKYGTSSSGNWVIRISKKNCIHSISIAVKNHNVESPHSIFTSVSKVKEPINHLLFSWLDAQMGLSLKLLFTINFKATKRDQSWRTKSNSWKKRLISTYLPFFLLLPTFLRLNSSFSSQQWSPLTTKASSYNSGICKLGRD